jgi:signal transduction histidine kinase
VLDNLMENAVHSATRNSERKGKVTISAKQENDFARIDITDDGRGFTPAALSHAMDPFFTTKDDGTGLGLSISFEIVQAHGGQLHLGNREGGGAIASLRLWLNGSRRDTLEQPAERTRLDG